MKRSPHHISHINRAASNNAFPLSRSQYVFMIRRRVSSLLRNRDIGDRNGKFSHLNLSVRMKNPNWKVVPRSSLSAVGKFFLLNSDGYKISARKIYWNFLLGSLSYHKLENCSSPLGRGKERGRGSRDFGEDHMTLGGYDGDRKWLQSMGGGGLPINHQWDGDHKNVKEPYGESGKFRLTQYILNPLTLTKSPPPPHPSQTINDHRFLIDNLFFACCTKFPRNCFVLYNLSENWLFNMTELYKYTK